jgi:hypothetical protein
MGEQLMPELAGEGGMTSPEMPRMGGVLGQWSSAENVDTWGEWGKILRSQRVQSELVAPDWLNTFMKSRICLRNHGRPQDRRGSQRAFRAQHIIRVKVGGCPSFGQAGIRCVVVVQSVRVICHSMLSQKLLFLLCEFWIDIALKVESEH